MEVLNHESESTTLTTLAAPGNTPANGSRPHPLLAAPGDNSTERDAVGAGGKLGRPPRPWVRPLLLGVLLTAAVVGGVVGWRYWRYASAHVSTDDAYLTTNIVPITPQVSGQIQRLLVDDNQPVKAGQLLVVLDDSTYRADVDQARANLAMAQASARGAASSVRLSAETGSAQVEQANGGVAQADVQHAQAAVATARAGEQSATADTGTARAGLQSAIAAQERAVAGVASAQAQVETAQAGVGSAQAAVTAAQAAADRDAKDAARYTDLYREGAVSQQTADTAAAAATASRAQLVSARQQVAQALDTVSQRQADLKGAQQQVRAADAAIVQAREQVAAAEADVRAARATTAQNQDQVLTSQQNLAQAEARRTQALGQLRQARTAPSQVAVSRANHQSNNARVQQAQAALQDALIALRRTHLYAPVSGTISQRTAQTGQQVAVGQPLMAVVPDHRIWVVANFQETQMTQIRPGQRAELAIDTFPGRMFTGRVDSIAAGTGATFALLPPDNATGNFTKVVQRVPVKIVFDPGQKDLDRLRSGLSVVATIGTTDSRSAQPIQRRRS
jgi:membrane fusion protein, multidrug efflux system